MKTIAISAYVGVMIIALVDDERLMKSMVACRTKASPRSMS